MTDANVNAMDIDSLLDATLDDLADVPEFKPFPAGTHMCTLNMETKVIADKGAVEWNLTLVSTLEMADPTATPPAAGDTCSGAFMFTTKDGKPNEIAQGQFKEMLRPLQAHFGTTTNRETMAMANGCEVVVTMSQREGKKGTSSEGKFFPVIDALVVA